MATLVTDGQSGDADRRRSLRIATRGSVVLRGFEHVVHGRLLNISLDAIEVACELSFVPDDLTGFDVGLRFDGVTGTWLHCPGRITHVRATRHTIVVHYEPLAPELHSAVAILEARRRASPPVMIVMIVDRDLQRRRLLAAGLRTEGCVVVEVATPLEALDWLGNGHPDPAIVLIGSTLPACTSDELEEYLSFAHPSSTTVRHFGQNFALDRCIAEAVQLLERRVTRASSI